MRWAALALLLLAGCTDTAGQVGDAVGDAGKDAGAIVADASKDAGRAITETATPIGIAIADAVATIQPQPPPAVMDHGLDRAEADPAVELITRWEVVSHAYYIKRLQHLICPPPPSGPTGGIGYDFGQQTRSEIRRVWGWHHDVEALVDASGQIGGGPCNAWRKAHPDVRITLEQAKRVFVNDSLPKYRRMAERALPGLDHQSAGHNSGLTSLGYRRGWSMEGERNSEKRVLRADCVPSSNPECSAQQVVGMCRIWVGKAGGAGQCNRSKDEARVIRSQ